MGVALEEDLEGVAAERWGRALLHDGLVHGWTCGAVLVPHLLHLLHGDTCSNQPFESTLAPRETKSQASRTGSPNSLS